jgi:flavin-dependent thymidylate synthase
MKSLSRRSFENNATANDKGELKMKVTLVSYTQDAAELLIFTKGTRLGVDAARLDAIKQWPEEQKLAELAYMANTIKSSWEFCDYVFSIEGVSRGFTHQFVRTRHGSYAQQSLRVVSMEQGYDFVMPERLTAEQRELVDAVNLSILDGYAALINRGVATEDARSILPTNIATNIVAKFNLRTMSELAKSRTGGRTQGEYINVMNAMCDEVIKVHPWAEQFLFPKARDLYEEIESFAEREYAGDLLKKGELLKIVDQMRKAK